MAGFVAETWKDIKGNAKWDIIKWLFGGSVIATAIALVRAASLYWRMQILIFVLSVLGFAAISFYQRAQAHKRTREALVDKEPEKLVIHSAVYGTGPIDDVSVTERLRPAVRDALVVPVDNNLVPRDPAIGKVKRLAVEYSYGNPSIQQASRLEGERLVLPEDSEIQRLRGEIEQLKRPEHPAKLRDRIFDVCLRLKAFLDKHGKRPDPYLIPIRDKEEYVRLYQERVQAWDDKFQADYWLNWKDKVLALRHELVLMSLTDDILDKKLTEADTSHLTDKTVEAINEKLRMLAAQLD